MKAVPVADFEGTKTGEHDLSLKVARAAAYVIQRKVVTEQANKRTGSATAKTRAEVRGGGRKPYKQKGTGNARRGSTRSPLIVGGGKSFGPRVKSFHKKINKKEGRIALSSALMGAAPRMTVIEDLDGKFETPKTSEMKAFLERVDVDTASESVLMIYDKRDTNVFLSAKNLPHVQLSTTHQITAVDILKAKKVLVSKSALKIIEDRFGA